MTTSTFVKISLPEQGPIGMFIVDEECKDYCVVRSLQENGQAKRFGVEVDDEIFFIPDKNGYREIVEVQEHDLKGMSAVQLKSFSQSSKRPIDLLVRRSQRTNRGTRSNGEDQKDHAPLAINVSNSQNDHEDLSDLLTKKEIDIALKYKRFPIIPFCRRCNDGSNTSIPHHYLCPKHVDFENSGANDKMVLIVAGIRDNCKACMYEFKNGKKSKNLKHNKKCGRPNPSSFNRKETTTNVDQIQGNKTKSTNSPNYEIPKNVKLQEKNGTRSKDKIEKKKKNELEKVSLKATSTIAKKVPSLDSNPSKIQRKTKQQTKGVSSKATYKVVKKMSSNAVRPKITNAVKKGRYDKVEKNVQPHTKVKDPKKNPKIAARSNSNVGNTDIVPVIPITPQIVNDVSLIKDLNRTRNRDVDEFPIKLTDDSGPVWVSCPNPWGDRTHQSGDFVLMSPSCYNLANEVQGSNPQRFVPNPFDSNVSEYHRSHQSPYHGCSVVELTRDPLALRSWGFTFALHDFGGACLVTSVEPYSPAENVVRIH